MSLKEFCQPRIVGRRHLAAEQTFANANSKLNFGDIQFGQIVGLGNGANQCWNRSPIINGPQNESKFREHPRVFGRVEFFYQIRDRIRPHVRDLLHDSMTGIGLNALQLCSFEFVQQSIHRRIAANSRRDFCVNKSRSLSAIGFLCDLVDLAIVPGARNQSRLCEYIMIFEGLVPSRSTGFIR